MYSGYVQSSVVKAHSFLTNLQSNLGNNDQYSFDPEKGLFVEIPIIKELWASLLYLGKYYPNALKKIIEGIIQILKF